ncbi:pep a2 [Streptomyces griseiscabiei]|uniref:Pep a2 n=1 Tax=Streptomyces griseiscabiei TaxID=2993540 RepID=A0ABU4L2U5_9ACTN|nr:pep a2 [Streptomyces griseiscabiei]MBZ3901656.1 pep a2 [Streptomyces griseiscabiei]MDX2909790.1 pep a2 [Streptomyces griseiscabiei]
MKPAVPRYYHLDVDVSPERVGQVSRILAAHLRFWDLETLVGPVCHSAELLLGAIEEHATDKHTSVEMWWNGQHLIAAVGENDRALRPDRELRPCLTRIAALSDGWGCCSPAGGGTVVWFTQRAPVDQGVPLVPTAPEPALRAMLQVPREAPVAALAGELPDLCGGAR